MVWGPSSCKCALVLLYQSSVTVSLSLNFLPLLPCCGSQLAPLHFILFCRRCLMFYGSDAYTVESSACCTAVVLTSSVTSLHTIKIIPRLQDYQTVKILTKIQATDHYCNLIWTVAFLQGQQITKGAAQPHTVPMDASHNAAKMLKKTGHDAIRGNAAIVRFEFNVVSRSMQKVGKLIG